MPSFPIRRQAPDVKYPEKVERRKGDHLRVQSIGTPPPDDTERASLSGATPSGFPKRTHGALPYPDSLREKHTALAIITSRMIAYPIRMLSGSLTKVHKPCYVILTACHSPRSAALRWCVRTSLPWIPKNSPQSRIALVIKKLSKHQNLTQFY